MFVVLVGLGSASELFLLRAHRGETYQRLVADAVAGLLRTVGVPARVADTTVSINAASVVVALECTGIKATAIFCAGVLAFPCTRRAKLTGLAVGVVGVGLLNVGRIVALTLVAGYRQAWFDSIHAVLMQGFLVLFVAPLWIVWMLRANRPATQK
mgnify:CR=1 FL=1